MGDHRTVLITGAASGIGAALCRRLAAPDITLVMHTGQNMQKLSQVETAVCAAGARAILVRGDLSDAGTATDMVNVIQEKLGRLDAFVSNAGFADRRPYDELDDQAQRRSFDAMPGAFLRLARGLVPLMPTGGRGRIVAVSSFVAHRYQQDGMHFTASAAAKAGLEALAKSLAVQLAPQGITVNCVVPGFIRKDAGAHVAAASQAVARALDHVPLGRVGLPDEIAATITFLLSDEAGYITGQSIHVDGGMTL